MTVQYAAVNGVRLEWDLVGSGPELVYLHGLSGNLEMDRRLCDALGEHFTVLWYSSRGHGRSTGPDRRDAWGYGIMADDLDAMIDVAGFHRPFLAGGSHGANTILRHAVEHPQRPVSGAAVIAPGGNALRRPPPWTFAALRTVQWWSLRQGDAGLIRLITGMDPAAGDADPVTVAAARTHDFATISRALRLVPDQQAVPPEALSLVTTRCVVSAWTGDRIIHPDAVARRIADLLPNARFEQIDALTGPADEVAASAAASIVRWHAECTSGA